jgi:hypothetical protein
MADRNLIQRSLYLRVSPQRPAQTRNAEREAKQGKKKRSENGNGGTIQFRRLCRVFEKRGLTGTLSPISPSGCHAKMTPAALWLRWKLGRGILFAPQTAATDPRGSP